MAGVFYPRMGRIPNDEKGGRHEIQEGVPGFELLVRWTFCATGDVTCAGAAPGGGGGGGGTTGPMVPPPTPGAAPQLGAKQAQVKEGNALVGLICGGNAACEGQLALLAPTAGASAAGKTKTIVYGTARYKLAASAKGTIKVKLNRRGKKLLAKHAEATVSVRLAPTGGTATAAKLTLKRAARDSRAGTGALREEPSQGCHVLRGDGTGTPRSPGSRRTP